MKIRIDVLLLMLNYLYGPTEFKILAMLSQRNGLVITDCEDDATLSESLVYDTKDQTILYSTAGWDAAIRDFRRKGGLYRSFKAEYSAFTALIPEEKWFIDLPKRPLLPPHPKD